MEIISQSVALCVHSLDLQTLTLPRVSAGQRGRGAAGQEGPPRPSDPSRGYSAGSAAAVPRACALERGWESRGGRSSGSEARQPRGQQECQWRQLFGARTVPGVLHTLPRLPFTTVWWSLGAGCSPISHVRKPMHLRVEWLAWDHTFLRGRTRIRTRADWLRDPLLHTTWVVMAEGAWMAKYSVSGAYTLYTLTWGTNEFWEWFWNWKERSRGYEVTFKRKHLLQVKWSFFTIFNLTVIHR